MNKKILAGISVLGVAAAFWACGDGDVIVRGGDDELALLNYGPPFAEGDEGNMKTLVNQAVAECMADTTPGGCAAKMEGAVDVIPPDSTGENGDTPASSGSGSTNHNQGPVVNTSSASVTPTGSSGSGSNTTPASSASTATDANDINGDCVASSTKISKGGSITWSVNPAKLNTTNVSELMDYQSRVKNTTCTWSIAGAAQAAVTGKCGDQVASTYAKPGDYKTTVKIGDKEKTCPVVTVEGAPISGCECTADNISPDVASGAQTVTWTVDPTTCTTTAKIASYTWTGATGTSNKATAQVKEKGDVVKPTVRVKTDEFSYVDVTCEEAQAINSKLLDKLPINQQSPIDAGTYTFDMTHIGWTGSGEGTLIYGTLGIGVEGTCTIVINGEKKTYSYSGTYTNTKETITLEVPANCVKSLSAY